MKKVAIVILNWNGEQMLRRFLPSVLQHSENVADIVVADNASTDASLALLEKEFPTVRTIVLDRNYGFAEGYNRALNQVENEYYVLLNSDVEVTEGWLDTLVSFMDSHPEAAACQPKLLAEHDHTLFEYAGASGGYIDRYGYPLYNPCVKRRKDGSMTVEPKAGRAYANRTKTFKYKIDHNDLAYQLFKMHGFTWGGDWRSLKDYQHFEKK